MRTHQDDRPQTRDHLGWIELQQVLDGDVRVLRAHRAEKWGWWGGVVGRRGRAGQLLRLEQEKMLCEQRGNMQQKQQQLIVAQQQ